MATVDELRDALEGMAARSEASSLGAAVAWQRACDEVERTSTSRRRVDDLSDATIVDLSTSAMTVGHRRARLWAGVAAAVCTLVIGVVAFAFGGEEQGLDTSFEPDRDGPAPTASTTLLPSTSTTPEDPWAFDVQLIEVDGLWSVDADETTAWGVPVATPAVPASDSGFLRRFELATGDPIVEIPIRANAVFVAVAEDGVWLSHNDGVISRVDPVTESVVATIEVGGRPWWIDVGQESVWVAVNDGDGEGRVIRLDPTTNSVAREIDTGSATVVMEGAGGVWAWNSWSNTAVRIDPATDAVVASVDLELPGLGLGVGPDAVWRAAGDGTEPGVVSRIDPETNAIGAHIEIEAPDGSVARPTGAEVASGSVWVPFEYGCQQDTCNKALARIDTETSTVVAIEPLPADSAIVVMVGPATVLVAGDGQLARVDISPG